MPKPVYSGQLLRLLHQRYSTCPVTGDAEVLPTQAREHVAAGERVWARPCKPQHLLQCSLRFLCRAPLASQCCRPQGEPNDVHVHAIDQTLSPPCIIQAGDCPGIGGLGTGSLKIRSDVEEERNTSVKVSCIVEVGGLHYKVSAKLLKQNSLPLFPILPACLPPLLSVLPVLTLMSCSSCWSVKWRPGFVIW